MDAAVAHHRAKLGNLYRHHPDDSHAIEETRNDLALSKVEAAIKAALASAPPLTERQCDRLAAILRGADR